MLIVAQSSLPGDIALLADVMKKMGQAGVVHERCWWSAVHLIDMLVRTSQDGAPGTKLGDRLTGLVDIARTGMATARVHVAGCWEALAHAELMLCTSSQQRADVLRKQAEGLCSGRVRHSSCWMQVVGVVHDLPLDELREHFEGIATSMRACGVPHEACWAMLYNPTWALASKFKAPTALCILAGALMEVPLTNTGLARRCLVDLREFTKLDVSWLLKCLRPGKVMDLLVTHGLAPRTTGWEARYLSGVGGSLAEAGVTAREAWICVLDAVDFLDEPIPLLCEVMRSMGKAGVRHPDCWRWVFESIDELFRKEGLADEPVCMMDKQLVREFTDMLNAATEGMVAAKVGDADCWLALARFVLHLCESDEKSAEALCMLAQGMRVGKVEDPSAWIAAGQCRAEGLVSVPEAGVPGRHCQEHAGVPRPQQGLLGHALRARLGAGEEHARVPGPALPCRELDGGAPDLDRTRPALPWRSGQLCAANTDDQLMELLLAVSHRRWARARGGFRRGHLQAGCAFLVPGVAGLLAEAKVTAHEAWQRVLRAAASRLPDHTLLRAALKKMGAAGVGT